jgi:hypothetical protein
VIQRSTIKWVGDKPTDKYTIVPNELARDPDLSPAARSIALYLWSHDDGFKMGTTSISTALGMRKPTVVKAMQELIDQGWLTRKECTGPKGGVYAWQYYANRSRRIKKPTQPDTQKSPRYNKDYYTGLKTGTDGEPEIRTQASHTGTDGEPNTGTDGEPYKKTKNTKTTSKTVDLGVDVEFESDLACGLEAAAMTQEDIEYDEGLSAETWADSEIPGPESEEDPWGGDPWLDGDAEEARLANWLGSEELRSHSYHDDDNDDPSLIGTHPSMKTGNEPTTVPPSFDTKGGTKECPECHLVDDHRLWCTVDSGPPQW